MIHSSGVDMWIWVWVDLWVWVCYGLCCFSGRVPVVALGRIFICILLLGMHSCTNTHTHTRTHTHTHTHTHAHTHSLRTATESFGASIAPPLPAPTNSEIEKAIAQCVAKDRGGASPSFSFVVPFKSTEGECVGGVPSLHFVGPLCPLRSNTLEGSFTFLSCSLGALRVFIMPMSGSMV